MKDEPLRAEELEIGKRYLVTHNLLTHIVELMSREETASGAVVVGWREVDSKEMYKWVLTSENYDKKPYVTKFPDLENLIYNPDD